MATLVAKVIYLQTVKDTINSELKDIFSILWFSFNKLPLFLVDCLDLYEIHLGIVSDFYSEVELVFASGMNVSHISDLYIGLGLFTLSILQNYVGTNIAALLSEQGGPSKLVQKHLAGLFNSITSFYHPSNNGRWLVSNVHILL